MNAAASVRLAFALLLVCTARAASAAPPIAVNSPSPVTGSEAATGSRASDEQILQAYLEASDGFGSDEIIIHDALRQAFFAAIDAQWQQQTNEWQTETLLRLLSLRKAGKLPPTATKRGPAVDDTLLPIAEIAVRRVLDERRVSSDRLLCDAVLRQQVLTEAQRLSAAIGSYELYKAILRLRKSRQLKPELVLRVTDWQRTIDVLTLPAVDEALTARTISTGPGVYLFRDKSGYLYIGEAVNLRARLQQHLSHSDRLSLRAYLQQAAQGEVTVELHIFSEDSPACDLRVRRAYESELIRSRHPRLNVRP